MKGTIENLYHVQYKTHNGEYQIVLNKTELNLLFNKIINVITWIHIEKIGTTNNVKSLRSNLHEYMARN